MVAAGLLFLLFSTSAARIEPWKPRERDPFLYLNLPHIRQAEERLQDWRIGDGRRQIYGTAETASINVTVDLTKHINEVSDGYLSVTMDAIQLREHLQNVSFDAPSFISTAKGLAPAVLRVGGGDGDYAIFGNGSNGSNATSKWSPDSGSKSNYTVTTVEWDKVNQFVQKVGWHLVYGLNLKLRSPWPIGAWDSSNAIELIKYSTHKDYNVSWELGNGETTIYTSFVVSSITDGV